MKRLLLALVAVAAVVAACSPPSTPEPPYCPTCVSDIPGTVPPPTAPPTTQPTVAASGADVTSFCPQDEVNPTYGYVRRVRLIQVHMANDHDQADYDSVDRFAVRWQWHIGGDVTGSGLGWSNWLEMAANPDTDNSGYMQAEIGRETIYRADNAQWTFTNPTWADDMMGMPMGLDPDGTTSNDEGEVYLQVEFRFGRSGILNPDTSFKYLYGPGLDRDAPFPLCIGRAGS